MEIYTKIAKIVYGFVASTPKQLQDLKAHCTLRSSQAVPPFYHTPQIAIGIFGVWNGDLAQSG